ncbi:MAG: hypothetical protein DCC67_11425 [Planctomycetota bacterium]|nr:MAG: hypothetical protein DCC67_11425 [Planctomycetota bacterium]
MERPRRCRRPDNQSHCVTSRHLRAPRSAGGVSRGPLRSLKRMSHPLAALRDLSSGSPADQAGLEQLVESIVERLQAGETIDFDEIRARHPEHAAELGELLPAMDMLLRLGNARNPPAPAADRDGVAPGDVLGDFRIVGELGRGGMGVVLEAVQLSMGRRVALKVLPFAALAQDKALQRFRNEVRAAAALDHPNIVSVYSVGQQRGIHFYAMQFIRGETLAQVIGQLQRRSATSAADPTRALQADDVAGRSANAPNGDDTVVARGDSTSRGSTAPVRLPPVGSPEFYRCAARFAVQAAEALQHAHDQGVLHRDVKPGNLLIDAQMNLYVADFGLARIQTDPGMTMTGDLLGTLRYMAPEQALGKRVVIDHRADVYSLGATLYEILGLEPAFDEADRAALLRQIAYQEPRPLRRRDRSIPWELEAIVGKAMAKEPHERYQTAQQLADDLKAFLHCQPIQARRPNLASRTAKWSRRHHALVAAASIVFVAVAAMLAAGTVLVNRARLEAESALEQKSSLLYLADMEHAYEAWAKGWISDVRRILARHRPGEGGDRRGVEWRLLNSLVQPPACLQLAGHQGAVNEIAVFPDCKRLASVGDDGTLRLWDTATGELLHTVALDDQPLYSVAVSPDGRYVAAASRSVHLCDGQQQYAARKLHQASDNAESLAFSPCGKYLLAGFRYAEVCRFDLAGNIVSRMPCNARVQSLEFLPDGQRLLMPTRDAKSDVHRHSHERLQLAAGDLASVEQAIDYHGSRASGIVLGRSSPCGEFVAAGKRNASAFLFHLPTELIVAETAELANGLADLSYAPDGQQLALGFQNGVVRLVAIYRERNAVEFGPRPEAFFAHAGGVHCVRHLSPGVLATAGNDGMVRIWQTAAWLDRVAARADASSPEVRRLNWDRPPAREPCFGIALSPDGRQLLYMANREMLHYDLASGRRLKKHVVRPGGRSSWSPDGRLGLCMANCDFVEIASPARPLFKITHGSPPAAVAFSPTGDLAALIGDSQFQLCRASSGAELFRCDLPGAGRAVAFSASGKQLAYGGMFEEIRVIDAATLAVEQRLPVRPSVCSMAYSPDGSRLAAGYGDGVIQIWDVATGRLHAELAGHERQVMDVAFAPDGRTLLSASSESVRLWAVEHGFGYGVLYGLFQPDRGDYRLSISADGSTLAIASRGRRGHPDVFLWQLSATPGG